MFVTGLARSDELTEENHDRTFDINVKGTFLTPRRRSAAIELTRRGAGMFRRKHRNQPPVHAGPSDGAETSVPDRPEPCETAPLPVGLAVIATEMRDASTAAREDMLLVSCVVAWPSELAQRS